MQPGAVWESRPILKRLRPRSSRSSPFRHDAGVVVSARLDRPALSEWCRRRLGSEPEQVLFEAGYLSQVVGLRLANGRDVVVKVRAWQERLTGCGQVQHSLSVRRVPGSAVVGAAGTARATRGER